MVVTASLVLVDIEVSVGAAADEAIAEVVEST